MVGWHHRLSEHECEVTGIVEVWRIVEVESRSRTAFFFNLYFLPNICSSVAQSCPTLCDPVDCSMSGFLAHHQFPELAQTHVH